MRKALNRKQKYEFAASKLQLFLGKNNNGTWLDSCSEDVQKLKKGEKSPLIETLSHKDKELLGEFGLQKVLKNMPTPSTDQIHMLVIIPENVLRDITAATTLLPMEQIKMVVKKVLREHAIDQEQWDDCKMKQQRIENDAHSRFEIRALTSNLKSFANAQLVEQCMQSQDHTFLPYPQENIQKLHIRKCYQDVFHLLIQCINLNKTTFAISGTPGIGKLLFFVYILYRLMNDFKMKTLSLKPNRVVYQIGPTFKCFDLQQQVVTRIMSFDAEGLVQEEDTFYVIDGQTSVPLISSCVALFISSPCSEEYKAFVKKAKKWYFPVWTLANLQTCWRHCYPDLPTETLQERYCIYGGVAHFVFHDNYSIPVLEEMQCALNDV
jgi:hypothetical protein